MIYIPIFPRPAVGVVGGAVGVGGGGGGGVGGVWGGEENLARWLVE